MSFKKQKMKLSFLMNVIKIILFAIAASYFEGYSDKDSDNKRRKSALSNETNFNLIPKSADHVYLRYRPGKNQPNNVVRS